MAEKEDDTLKPMSAASTSSSSSSSSSSTAPPLFTQHFAEPTNSAPSDGSSLPPGIQFAAAADRNKAAIAAILQQELPAEIRVVDGPIFEVSSGTGQHCAHFASVFRDRAFQPSDQSSDGFPSISYHARDQWNVLRPIVVDLLDEKTWSEVKPSNYMALYCANMLHISQAGTTVGLFKFAQRILARDAPILVYGPFKKDGEPTTESNRAFDEKLRKMNPAFGLRDIAAVAEVARQYGFELTATHDMPSAKLHAGVQTTGSQPAGAVMARLHVCATQNQTLR